MKKRMLTLIAGICTAAMLAGCSGNGKISNDKITIEQYKGIEVEKADIVEATDEHVEQSIASTLEVKAVEMKEDRAIKEGDIAVFDYVGKADGKEFDSATDTELLIGSGRFVPGFEDGLIGHKVGEKFDMNLTFPEDYYPELAGKEAVFTITVKGIKVIPELTDELVKEISDKSKTVEEYKKEVKADLQKSNDDTAKSALQSNLWDAVIKKCTVAEYPKKEKDDLISKITEQYDYMASMYGEESGEALAQRLHGVSIEKMAEDTLAQQFAVELIAEKEKLSLTDKEYKEGLEKYAKQYNAEDAAAFEKEVGKENVEKTLLQEKVTDWLIENCKQVEKKESK